MNVEIEELFGRHPALGPCRADVEKAFALMLDSVGRGGKILACGNGGSAADSEHLVGELMKKFKRPRPVPAAVASRLRPELAAKLEGAISAVSLVSMTGLVTAIANDVSWETVFAQQVLGLARSDDVLVAFSTSGNSEDCVTAAETMKAVGGRVVALTGARESRLSALADAAIRVPETETYRVQELHLPVYHALAAALESSVFGASART